MENTKKCSGCKEQKPLNEFYKNKLMDDGHSIYCVPCTKENSKKYHQRKKVRLSHEGNEKIVQQMIVQNLMSDSEQPNVEKLMKLILIERSLTDILNEVKTLKMEYVTADMTI